MYALLVTGVLGLRLGRRYTKGVPPMKASTDRYTSLAGGPTESVSRSVSRYTHSSTADDSWTEKIS